MKTELRKREDIPPIEAYRVEDASDSAKWPDVELGNALKAIFPPIADIGGTIKKLRGKDLYLLAPGVAKKPLSHLPPLAPKPLAPVVAAPASKLGGSGGGGQGNSSDPRVYVPTEQEEKEIVRKIELSEKSPRRPFIAPPPPPPATEKLLNSNRSVPSPTKEERELAGQENAQPDDGLNATRFTAREKVVRDFYEDRPGLGQARADQDMGVDPVTGVPNANPKGYGIDLNGPVRVVDLPPPEQINQFVKSHGFPGNFFDPVGNQSGDSLGLNADPSARASKTFNVPPAKQQGLVSRNGPIIDDWTDPKKPTPTRGGGTQLTVDDAFKKSLAPQPQPW
jgi:hypothetical protein